MMTAERRRIGEKCGWCGRVTACECGEFSAAFNWRADIEEWGTTDASEAERLAEMYGRAPYPTEAGALDSPA